MTGGVLNPPVFLYSADYEALTENTILYHKLDRRLQGRPFIHKIVDLVDKLEFKGGFLHRMRDLVDKTQSKTMSTKLQ